MSQKKSRRSLDDPAALGFVYGEPQPQAAAEPIEPDEPEPDAPEPPKPARKPRAQSKPPAKPQQPNGDFMSQLLDKTADKEPTVRVTVDLPQSMHQKLSILCARTNTKKADVIRGLLNEALQQLND